MLALLLLQAPCSTAEIQTLTITSDTRPMILIEKFGFTGRGHVSISVSSVSVVAGTGSQPEPSRLGFFLLSEESLLQVLIEMQQNPNFCVLDSHYTNHLFTFRCLSPPPASSFNHTYPLILPARYSLFFANCNPESSVSMKLHTEFFTLNRDGSRNYLPSGHALLPSLFFLFSILYFSFLAFWLYLCHVSNHSLLHRIHFLMPSLLLAKALSLLFAAAVKHHANLTGISHAWDDVTFLVFDFVSVVLLFTVVVLVGTRWTFLHPLRQRGKTVLFFVVLPLQILAHVAFVVVHNTGPYIQDWVTWNQILLLLDFISCCAVVFLFLWAIRLLRRITSKAQSEPAMNLDRFRLIKRFYLVVLGYFLMTRFGVFVLRTIIAYEYEWVSNLAEETVTLVFCIVMFYMFRLVEKDEYSVLAEIVVNE
uniref:Protein GPR107 family n=2 Tax=Cajanus cajan TaxID=3821 RepID=A0A151RVZ4_CAJCA|nr:Protein GPR107 family [Cajanus cajan]